MKSVVFSLLLISSSAFAETAVSTFVRPATGIYNCHAYRAWDSSAPTDIVYSTEDDFVLTIARGDKMVITTPYAVATLSSEGATPTVRNDYYRPALRHDVTSKWTSRRVLNRRGSDAYINYVDLSPMDTGTRSFIVRVEFNHNANSHTHWKRPYRCK